MPSIPVSEATYQRLAARAAALHTTVEALAAPALEHAAGPAAPPTPDLPPDEWQREFEAIIARARARAHRYPPGFEADVSREAMYEGCGE